VAVDAIVAKAKTSRVLNLSGIDGLDEMHHTCLSCGRHFDHLEGGNTSCMQLVIILENLDRVSHPKLMIDASGDYIFLFIYDSFLIQTFLVIFIWHQVLLENLISL
jgi:hypothetical protein